MGFPHPTSHFACHSFSSQHPLAIDAFWVVSHTELMCEFCRDPGAASLLPGCDLPDLAPVLPLQPTFSAPPPSLSQWASTISTSLQMLSARIWQLILARQLSLRCLLAHAFLSVSQVCRLLYRHSLSAVSHFFFSSWTGRHRADK